VLLRATSPMHLQIRFLTSTLCRPVSRVCASLRKEVDAFVFDTVNMSIGDVDPHVMSVFDLHILDSVPAPCDDFDDHQVKTTPTACAGPLDSGEAWVTLFYEKRTNAEVSIGSHLQRGLSFRSLLIRPTALQHTDPLPKPVLCASRVAASDPESYIDSAPPDSPLPESNVSVSSCL
jgi:hypothetical protein